MPAHKERFAQPVRGFEDADFRAAGVGHQSAGLHQSRKPPHGLKNDRNRLGQENEVRLRRGCFERRSLVHDAERQSRFERPG